MIYSNKRAVTVATTLVVVLQAPMALAGADTHAFDAALAGAYQSLAKVEQASGDHRDADTYRARADAARRGSPTDPDQLEMRQPFLKAEYLSELSAARQRLVATFEKDARAVAPGPAARAQSSFDCWVEQASEDLQPGHINACKQAFMVAVADVEKALIPPPPPPVDPDSDGDGVPDSRDDCPDTAAGTVVDEKGCPQIPDLKGVHFAHDKATLTEAARAVLDAAVTAVKRNPYVRLEIVGHTDSSGSDAYNLKLSKKRADAVRGYLIDRGVAASAIEASGRGESVPIADNVTREGRATNRRVEIAARPR